MKYAAGRPFADPEKAAERHDRIRDLAGELVDHKMVYSAEVLSLMVVYGRSIDLL